MFTKSEQKSDPKSGHCKVGVIRPHRPKAYLHSWIDMLRCSPSKRTLIDRAALQKIQRPQCGTKHHFAAATPRSVSLIRDGQKRSSSRPPAFWFRRLRPTHRRASIRSTPVPRRQEDCHIEGSLKSRIVADAIQVPKTDGGTLTIFAHIADHKITRLGKFRTWRFVTQATLQPPPPLYRAGSTDGRERSAP